MKKLIVLLALFLVGAVAFAETIDPNKFFYSANVNGPIKRNGLYQLHIDEELIGKSAPDFHDVRLFDENKGEVPFVILDHRLSGRDARTFPLKVSGFKEQDNSIEIIVKMPGLPEVINEIFVETDDKDFQKKVVISGSNDSHNWVFIKNDAIFDFSSQVNLRKTRLSIPESKYLYYQLRMEDSGSTVKAREDITLKYGKLDFRINGAAKRRIRINEVYGRDTTSMAEYSTQYDKKDIDNFTGKKDKDGNTVIVFEAQLPFDKMIFDISNPYYFRKIKIYGGNKNIDKDYKYLTDDYLYGFAISETTQKKCTIYYTSPKYKYYKVVVYNKNNPTLDVKRISLEWGRKNIFFIALNDAKNYKLCFGNSEVGRPVYDLSNFINQANWERQSFTKINRAEISVNEHLETQAPPEPESQKGNILLTTIVILLVVGLAIWVYKLTASVSKQQGK